MAKPVSREYRIYLAIWRKAFHQRDGEPLAIKASNLNMAISMRQGMYRAIAPYRNGLQFDEELRQASELFVVYLEKLDDPTKPHSLTLKPRLALTELERELEALGIAETDLLIGEERVASPALDQFLGDVELPSAPTRATPFYTRED